MSEPKSADRQTGTRTWLILGTCVFAYVLSSGPVVWLLEHGYISRSNQYIWAFYAPVDLLARSNETLMNFFKWYLGLWGARFP